MQPNTNSMLVCVYVFSACWWLGIYNDKTVCYSYSSHHTAATCIYAEQPLKRRTLGVSESIPDILSLLPLVVAISGMKLLCVCVCMCMQSLCLQFSQSLLHQCRSRWRAIAREQEGHHSSLRVMSSELMILMVA